MESKQFDEGLKAFWDGKYLDDNPYPEGTKENTDWHNGYVVADGSESGFM